MVKIPLGITSYQRSDAQQPLIPLINRYFEANPTNQVDGVAVLARPGLKRWLEVGAGPVRTSYSCPGSFDDALFVVSGDQLYRIDRDETVTHIAGTFQGRTATSAVSMAATANIGGTPEFLFIADGQTLQVYIADGFGIGTLTASAVANNDTISIAGIWYKWTTGSVNAGTPAGTNANPWLVDDGANLAEALANMLAAINEGGTAGTTYSTALTANPAVSATASTGTTLSVRAINAGIIGNVAVTETGANTSWGGAALTGGGSAQVLQVPTPDDVGIISVGWIAGYTICVVAQGYGMNGRFYWIDPGEIVIDPLNFATAERSPDPIHEVVITGDQFMLPGTSSTEFWYPTGDFDAPMQRQQGRLFDRGTWPGTAVQVKDAMIVVDPDGTVYAIAGAPQRISNHSIEQRIRKAMIEQRRMESV
jgi:hypothetical protein